MSHEIENEEIAYVGEVPWHGLGTRVPEGAMGEEFLKAAKLDWTLEKHALIAHPLHNAEIDDSRPGVDIKHLNAWVRSDNQKPLVVAGKRWRPLQNRDAIGFMDKYVRAGGATMETVGALNGGRIVWALAKLNHSYETRPGDRTEGYLLLTSANVLGMSNGVRTTSVRVVCRNTMVMAEGEGTLHYRQNHLSDWDVERAREAVEQANESLAAAARRAKILDGIRISADDAVRKVILPLVAPEFFNSEDDKSKLVMANAPRSAKEILNSIVSAPGAIDDTAWGMLNGVTHWADHVAGRGQDSRLMSAWLGDRARLKVKVEDALLQLA